ncbi:hypothetical protein [Tomitella gaofuii]|uniref:hypothetical protein n=1 Tax=Tomitella gaofuii TaxID=2760083 RepID=UPI0015FD5903|nr:hypothetical protein [Tomitella gaofuii]
MNRHNVLSVVGLGGLAVGIGLGVVNGRSPWETGAWTASWVALAGANVWTARQRTRETDL